MTKSVSNSLKGGDNMIFDDDSIKQAADELTPDFFNAMAIAIILAAVVFLVFA